MGVSLRNQDLSDVATPLEPAGSVTSRSQRKVFYLLDSLNVGGTETQAVELARRIPAAGYQVTLGCLRAQGPLLQRLADTPVILREFHPNGGIDSPAGIYQLLRLSQFLRKRKFDIVHTHDLWSNLMGVPAARLAGVPAIVSSRRDLAHFDWYRGKRRAWLRRIQNLSGAVLANASPIREALIAEDRFAPEKVHVIHNGIDIEKFRKGRDRRGVLFPNVGDAKLVVLVGNMHSDVKGHPWLIECAPRVTREFRDVRFVLVGDGAQRAQFEQQVARLDLTSNFLFLGSRADIPDILAACDIAVLPSRAEGLSNALLEYLAAGLPTIVSRVGGNPELVEDGVSGFVVPPESEALGIALLKMLRDPELMRSFGERGREFVVQNFSFERLVREVDALYTAVLREHGGNH
jgi:L-malate glycosyltransferase